MATTGELDPTTTAPDPDAGRTFPCESCGADLVFHVGAQQLKCPYCGFSKQIETGADRVIEEQDLAGMLERVRELRDDGRNDEQGFQEVLCDACHGTVRFQGTVTSRHCAWCGSPLQLEQAHRAPHRVPVDGVLPFGIDRDTAWSRLRDWVGARWFAPNAFRPNRIRGRFQGVYLPYWTFDSMTGTVFHGQRGDHYYVTVGSGKNRRRVRRTRWTPVSGSFQRFFDDVTVVASGGLPKKRIDALEPWPLERARPFAPTLLAGFLSRTYDVELEQGFAQARERIDEAIHSEVRSRIGGDTQRVVSVQSSYDALTYKHLLLPVWMLAYRFRKKVYQVVVNAATGEVQGDRPWSWIKLTLAIAAGLAIATAILVLVNR